MRILLLNSYCYYGGPLVISQLCAELRKLGYDAQLLMAPFFPHEYYPSWKYKIHIFLYQMKALFLKCMTKILPRVKCFWSIKNLDLRYTQVEGVKYAFFPFVGNNDIVIYPEQFYGNPVGAKNVVRWLLYHYNYEKDATAYKKKDLFIAFRKVFNSPNLNPQNYIVKIEYFNDKLYRKYNCGERTGNCYILRKGKFRDDLPKTFDGPVFDDNMSQEEFVKILNTCKYCYDYDTQTFYATIAAVCGCIPVIKFEDNKRLNSYRSNDELEHPGIAWGDSPEQIQYAIETRVQLLKSLDFSQSNRKNALKLVDILHQHFGMPIKEYKLCD